MKISAIICEFNPLHTGHKRLIDYAKSISDKVICIMSGNFVQRGMPACADKYDRARHAILAGADMVVELPTVFATSSAENFACGAVKIANQLDVDYLVFGSECGEISPLIDCAQMINNDNVNEKIRQNLAKGMSYPKAVSLATNCDLLKAPNNTLAIEYLRAIAKFNSKIIPKTLKRENNYNGQTTDEYTSSTRLRADATARAKYTFDYVTTDICDEIESKYCDFATHYLSLLSANDFVGIEGISEGIENKIMSANKNCGFDAMMEQIKSKRYTRAKLQRIILNCILKIQDCYVEKRKRLTSDIKVLAIKKDCTILLQKANNIVDEVTIRADKLYYSFYKKQPPLKLQKLD